MFRRWAAAQRCGFVGTVLVVLIGLLLPGSSAQQTLKISATLTLEKDDDKNKTHTQVLSLLNHAKEKKLEGNVVRFLENMVGQLDKVLEAAKILEQQRRYEVPKDFTPMKYRVKPMPKLQAKKTTAKKISATELRQRLQEGKHINFVEPMLVENASALFEGGRWDDVRRHWSAGRIMADEGLERDLRLEYWPPEKARARLVGNMLQMEEPELVAFSRYIVICFHGTPAKPKLPGQNTEHCEQNVVARKMVRNASELTDLSIFSEIQNALPLQAEVRHRLIEAAGEELSKILGKNAEKWKRRTGETHFQFFTFGPSGSGDKLHAENGLPFFDVLLHGSRRWLLLKEDVMNAVAEKAKEALEFDKTSAYMFFEEKLPELREEFGLKKYVELNQQAGDLVIVPSGWFRVSLSLADSISFYETILSEKETFNAVTDSNVWRPNMRQYQLAFCYGAEETHKLPNVQKDSKLDKWLKNAIDQVSEQEQLPGIFEVLLTCGSALALTNVMPQLGDVSTETVCSPAVWRKCRKRLETKLRDKGIKASLDWLPKEAPSSAEDVRPARAEL